MAKKAVHKFSVNDGRVEYFCETARHFHTADCTLQDNKVTCKKCLQEIKDRKNRKKNIDKAYGNIVRMKEEMKRQEEERRMKKVDKVVAGIVKSLLLILSFFSLMAATYGLVINRMEAGLIFFFISIILFMVREMI